MTEKTWKGTGKRIFGIDLGTTYSSIAYVNDFGVPEILNNAQGQRSTPSVIYLDGDRVIVGSDAVKMARSHPEDVVSFVKRSMGEAGFQFIHRDHAYTAEELSSFILRKLVSDAEKHVKETITEVVITCPAYFGINEREATRVAGEIAGLNVRQIINEPTAAAIAYGSVEMKKEHVVLVYDLGGGTFDITMIAIQPESIRVIGTGGDHNLGGKDWDDRIVMYTAEQAYNITGKDLLEDMDAWSALQFQAEKAKIALSQSRNTKITLEVGGQPVDVNVTQLAFEEMTQDLMERTISLTREMLDEARDKGFDRFDEIILVGGSTGMPMVSRGLTSAFDIEPRVFHPDDSIAKGAAIFGWKLYLKDEMVERILSKKEEEDDFSLDAEAFSDNFEKAAHVASVKKELDLDLSDLDLDMLSEDTSLELDIPGQESPKTTKAKKAREALSEEDMELDMGVSSDDFEEAANAVANATGYSAGAVKNSIFEIQDVAAKSFGIVARNKDDEEGVSIVVERNSPVPVSVEKTFKTAVANQQKIHLRIMESETHDDWVGLGEAVEIGEAWLNLPKGMPVNVPVDIAFSLNREGRLDMTATEQSGGRSVELSISTQAVLSGEELEEAKARSVSLVIS